MFCCKLQVNIGDKGVVDMSRAVGLVAVAGRALMLLCAMRGVSLKERGKKNEWRELPRRFARYEIGPFPKRSTFVIKREITTKTLAKDERRAFLSAGVVQKRVYCGCMRADQSNSAVHAQYFSPVRARVCVFTSVWTSARNEGRRRIKPRKEGWWTIPAVVRHKWWVVAVLRVWYFSSFAAANFNLPKRPRFAVFINGELLAN